MMPLLRHFITTDHYSHANSGGNYLLGTVTQKEHLKKRGPAICKKCNKVMHNVPKGYADYCNDCNEEE